MATAKRNIPTLAIAPTEAEQKKAAKTHTEIRQYLESDPVLKKYRVDTYLQGSYKNSTNVRGDSDVDMGSLTEEAFYHDTTWLPADPQFDGIGVRSLRDTVDGSLKQLGNAPFNYFTYRADVLASLIRQYGASVIDGNKAIKVRGNADRLDADVLPCTAFRQYYKDYGGRPAYHNGIAFFTKSYDRVVNFPHQHFDNLAAKDQSSGGKVKGCIRIVKRIRNELEDRREWDRKRSPSFYLESLIWNAPGHLFEGGYDTVLIAVLVHLWADLRDKRDKGGLDAYIQANRIFPLFHSRFWSADDAIAFIEKIWESTFTSN